jgi:hypothetical protein
VLKDFATELADLELSGSEAGICDFLEMLCGCEKLKSLRSQARIRNFVLNWIKAWNRIFVFSPDKTSNFGSIPTEGQGES